MVALGVGDENGDVEKGLLLDGGFGQGDFFARGGVDDVEVVFEGDRATSGQNDGGFADFDRFAVDPDAVAAVAIGEVLGVEAEAIAADAQSNGAVEGEGGVDGGMTGLDFKGIILGFGEEEFADGLEAIGFAVEGFDVGVTVAAALVEIAAGVEGAVGDALQGGWDEFVGDILGVGNQFAGEGGAAEHECAQDEGHPTTQEAF